MNDPAPNDLALADLREHVASQSWSYRTGGPKATEPAAFAGISLCANGLAKEALPIAKWLEQLQKGSGSVGVTDAEEKPAWPTSMALLLWLAMKQSGIANFQRQEQAALDWILQTKGKGLPRRRQMGHDTTILGWSWAENTHSWLEPTCLCVLALKAGGLSGHERAKNGIAMIVDRLHKSGGCNYGNTVVLGQSTLAHVQPTGLAMLALADCDINDQRIDRSLDYLESSLASDTATASLCFALLGLTAHHRRPAKATALLENALQRDKTRNTMSCYKLALLSLAASENRNWVPSYRNKTLPLASQD